MRRVAALLLIVMAGSASAQPKRPPYWASLSAGDALMRSGPGREYPALWRYRRVGLPLKVVAVHESWRKVREMDGTEGWMASVLLSDERTALITGEIRVLRAAPDAGAKLLWRVEPGVVGRISHCAAGWCEFDVRGRTGFVEQTALWGVEPGETLE